ncbi:hypothetical protein D3C71_1147630 [compost metagenome]
MAHKAGEDDGAQVTTTVRRQRLLTTGIGRRDVFAIVQVVVFVDAPQEQDTGLGKVVGRLHDGVPQLACGHGGIHPLAVCTLVGALGEQRSAGASLVHQLPLCVVLHGCNELVRNAHRHIEVIPAPWRALGRDELVHIGMVDAQHAHLRPPPRARALHGGAGLIEHVHVAARPGCHGGGGLHLCALGTDAGEVIAHASATAHGLGRLTQRFVDARKAFVIHALNTVTHGLHKAVDEGGLYVGACRAHDAARADGACLQVGEEQGFVLVAQLRLFDRGQSPRHTLVQLVGGGFARFEVFLAQYIQADGLQGRGGLEGGLRFAFHGGR